MKINWKGSTPEPKVLRFNDLELNEGFRNASSDSLGAVYIKTRIGDNGDFYMYEVATGRNWLPTKSVVERVPIEMNVDVPKPKLYTENL